MYAPAAHPARLSSLVWALCAVLVGAFLLCAPAPSAHAANVGSADPLALDLLALINGERVAVGLPPLAVDAGADQVALLRAEDMAAAGYFAHVNQHGIDAATLLRDRAVAHTIMGENIARSIRSPEWSTTATLRLVHDALMRSPEHRDNVVDERFRGVGIGIAEAEGWTYFAIVFVD